MNAGTRFHRIVMLCGLVAVLCVALIAAQTKSGTDPVPFLPKGFPSPDEFFERMFGNPEADDRQALEAIEVSFKEEVAFGQPQVEAFLAYLQRSMRFHHRTRTHSAANVFAHCR